MLKEIENAKHLVSTPEWPRPIDKFPKGTENCWGFALDGMKIPVLQKRTYYSENNDLDEKLFSFFENVGLNPRKLSSATEKKSNEMVFLFYIYEYEYFNMRTEDYGSRTECHVARIELDGTVIEKASSKAEPVITSLERIEQRLFNQDNVVVKPIMFAVRKPH